MEREYLGMGVKAAGGFVVVVLIIALFLVLAAGLSALMVYGIYASITAFMDERIAAGVLWGMLSSVLLFTQIGMSARSQR